MLPLQAVRASAEKLLRLLLQTVVLAVIFTVLIWSVKPLSGEFALESEYKWLAKTMLEWIVQVMLVA